MGIEKVEVLYVDSAIKNLVYEGEQRLNSD